MPLPQISILNWLTFSELLQEAQRSGSKFWADKVRLLENYTFSLVLENSNTYDYVTEKLFQALLAGSIPGSLLASYYYFLHCTHNLFTL